MRVALIRSRWHSCWDHLASGYLFSYTRDLVHPDDYLFLDAWFETDETIIHQAADCEIVGLSGTSSQMPHAIRLAHAIRERNPDVRCYVGGYGPSVDPGSF